MTHPSLGKSLACLLLLKKNNIMTTAVKIRKTNAPKSTATAMKAMIKSSWIPSELEAVVSEGLMVSLDGSLGVGVLLMTVLVLVAVVTGEETEQTGEGRVASSEGAHAELGTSSIPPTRNESPREAAHSCSVVLSSVTFSTNTSVML